MLVKRRIIAIAVAAAMMIVALVGVAVAQDGAAPTEKSGAVKVSTAVVAAEDTDLPAGTDDQGEFIDECSIDDWEPTAEELAETNAETDALVEYLNGKGFDVAVETDELGFTYVDIESEDEALFAAIDDFYAQLWADEVAGWSDAEKAEFNSWTDEFVAEMAEQGITVETEEIAPGVYDIVWTEELDEALMDLEGDIFIDEEWEPTAEELAEINAETDALVEYLQGTGFDVTVETDDLGFRYVDFTEDDETLFEAIDDFYAQLWADEVAGWSDAEKAEWNAEIDAFVAELEADGITVATEEIAPGVYDIVWTEELDAVVMDLEPLPEECFIEFDDEFVDELEEA